MVFFGHAKEEGEHLQDAGLRQFSTYGILAGVTLAIGFVGPVFESSLFSAASSFLGPYGIIESGAFTVDVLAVATSLTVFLVGGLLAYPFYITKRMSPGSYVDGSPFLRGIYGFLWHRWYLDAVYYRLFVNPVRFASTWGFQNMEKGFFDRINGGVAGGARGLSSAGDWFDRNVVDAFVNALARLASAVSSRLRRLQTGVAESYLFFILIGLILLLLLLTFYTGGAL